MFVLRRALLARTATDGCEDEDHHERTARSRPLKLRALGEGFMFARYDHADLLAGFGVFGYP